MQEDVYVWDKTSNDSAYTPEPFSISDSPLSNSRTRALASKHQNSPTPSTGDQRMTTSKHSELAPGVVLAPAVVDWPEKYFRRLFHCFLLFQLFPTVLAVSPTPPASIDARM